MRGMEIQSVGSSSISYDEASQKLINMRNQGAMLSDASIREGYVQGAIAHGLEAAGSNSAGAAAAFMGMGVGMNAAGGFMNTASANNMAQMQMQQAAQQAKTPANGWTCGCGTVNTGKFCSECGKPAPAAGWVCECGTKNTGKFCSECGKPAPAAEWMCTCGTKNTGKFCSECGKARG